jgi:glutamate N-acetyltransferase/amino-acid N-acetyltransferase
MIELVQGGGVTSPKGFVAGAVYAGIKSEAADALDLGLLLSEAPAAAAGTFTKNVVVSPSVVLSRDRVANGSARGVVVNSGCANCAVGHQGLTDAEEMTALAAGHAGVDAEQMLVCSTGLIGVELPMALIRQNIGNVGLNRQGGNEFARAIMTTDTRAKELAVTVDVSGRRVTVGGAAKGVGMIHPDMATMLAFIATDADAEASFLQGALREAVDASFNMVDVDGDTSTNDTVLAFANGAGGAEEIREGTGDARAFQEALTYVCTALAKELVRDGEGARRLMEVVVEGAATREDARAASKEVAGSLLVKTMVHGRDPNWGRVMAALGKSRVDMDESKVDLFINDIHIVHEGRAFSFLKEAVISSMSGDDVCFRVDLHEGGHSATAWGCDLTEEYVVFNSAYST